MSRSHIWEADQLESLGQEASALAAILDALPLGAVVTGPSHRLLFLNEEDLRTLDLRAEQVRGVLLDQFFQLAPFAYPDGRPCPAERRPLMGALGGESSCNKVFIVASRGMPRTLVVVLVPSAMRWDGSPRRSQPGRICPRRRR